MAAVMTYLGEATDWPSVKKIMGTSDFMKRIFSLEPRNLKPDLMKKIA